MLIKIDHLGLFFIYVRFFQTNNTIIQQINVKNVHRVSSGEIQTHGLLNMSLLPEPLDQGSRPSALLRYMFDNFFVLSTCQTNQRLCSFFLSQLMIRGKSVSSYT